MSDAGPSYGPYLSTRDLGTVSMVAHRDEEGVVVHLDVLRMLITLMRELIPSTI